MKCAYVLGLIDLDSFADYPRAHIDAAHEHARECATCGAALQLASALTTELAALPQPVPPPELAASVLARIARTESDGVIRGHVRPRTCPRSSTREITAWGTLSGALVAGVALAASVPFGHPMSIGMPVGVLPSASPTIWILILTVGLALYVVSMFSAVSGEKDRWH